MRYLLVILVLGGCAHKPPPVFDNMAPCTTQKIPADDEFMTMPYSLLYGWYTNAKMAQDILAMETVAGKPHDPCTVLLAYKGYNAIEEAVKYR